MVDTVITLFESTATTFTTNGLGGLPDVMKCKVTEERNGVYELEMEYPIDGLHYSDIALRRIVFCKPNPYADRQPFRIYSISKPINGIVTINAEHISYDLSGIPVKPFKANSAGDAVTQLKNNAVTPCPFIFSTDKTTSAEMNVTTPKSIRNLLGGEEGSLLDIYGGEYEFDKYHVYLRNDRGSDRGVTIRYGKNLTDIKQEENCANVYTGVYPYYFSESDGLVQLGEKILNAEGTFNFTRILPLDLSGEFQEKPSESALRDRAKKYMTDNKIGIPKVSLDVSFILLSQSEEYAEYALLENVYLCDQVSVYFPELGVTNDKVKCIKTEYDAITDKYISISLGDAESKLSTTIASQNDKIEAAPTKSFMDKAIDHATQLITGGLGGYVVMRNSSGSKTGKPDEILIMDTDSIDTATEVWRWNKGGLGYSDNGYNGPYKTAITQDGKIVADFITTGTMLASIIRGGTMSLGGRLSDGTSLGNGAIHVYDQNGNRIGRLDLNGLYAVSGQIADWNIKSNELSYDDGSWKVRLSAHSNKVLDLTGGERGWFGFTSDSRNETEVHVQNVYSDDVHCEWLEVDGIDVADAIRDLYKRVD